MLHNQKAAYVDLSIAVIHPRASEPGKLFHPGKRGTTFHPELACQVYHDVVVLGNQDLHLHSENRLLLYRLGNKPGDAAVADVSMAAAPPQEGYQQPAGVQRPLYASVVKRVSHSCSCQAAEQVAQAS